MKRRFPDLTKAKYRLFKIFGVEGPHADFEFKEKIQQIADATNSVTQEKIKPATKIPPVRVPLEEYVKELENKIERINKQLLGTATIATSTAANILDPDRIEYFKRIAKASYADVKQTDPHSDLINLTGPFLKLCMNCKWGTKKSMYEHQIDEEPSYVGLDYIKCEKDQEKKYYTETCDKWEPHPR